ncbi:Plasma membrane sulfite pump involved in sulfite metabolism, partial [Linderina pennispora]
MSSIETPCKVPTTYPFWKQVRLSFLSKVDHATDLIRWFMPSWFTVSMGTGILANCLTWMPFATYVTDIIGRALFFVNILLLSTLLIVQLVQFVFYPGIFQFMRRNPRRMLHYGAIPISLGTAVIGIVRFQFHQVHDAVLYAAWGVWWASVGLSVVCSLLLLYLIISREIQGLESLTGAWLLPVAPLVVSATAGAAIAEFLPENCVVLTLLVSYCLWGAGTPLIGTILVLYFHRLTIHKLPPPDLIVTAFIPLGPVGQIGAAAVTLGSVAQMVVGEVLPHLEGFGSFLYNFGILIALASWGSSVFWAMNAVYSIAYRRWYNNLPFNIGWWSFTFPIGVFTTL